MTSQETGDSAEWGLSRERPELWWHVLHVEDSSVGTGPGDARLLRNAEQQAAGLQAAG